MDELNDFVWLAPGYLKLPPVERVFDITLLDLLTVILRGV